MTTSAPSAIAASDGVLSSPASMRQANSRAVLRHLVESRSSVTAAQLSSVTGLTAPTVHGALELLRDEGWIKVNRADRTAGQVGRSAQQAQLRQDGGVVIGVDLQRHRFQIIVAHMGGAILRRESHAIVDEGAVGAVERVLFDALSSATDGAWGPLRAVTIGVPGIVGKGIVSEAVPEWSGTDLADAIRLHWGDIPVAFANDLKLAAGAELSMGGLRGIDNGVYLHLGSQIGAAVVVGGRVVIGHSGAAGELGVLTTSRWHDVGLMASDGMSSPSERVRILSPSLGALIATVDPEIVVISGDDDIVEWLPMLATQLGHLAPGHPHILNPSLIPSQLGEGATALGAVDHALRYTYTHLMKMNGEAVEVVIA